MEDGDNRNKIMEAVLAKVKETLNESKEYRGKVEMTQKSSAVFIQTEKDNTYDKSREILRAKLFGGGAKKGILMPKIEEKIIKKIKAVTK